MNRIGPQIINWIKPKQISKYPHKFLTIQVREYFKNFNDKPPIDSCKLYGKVIKKPSHSAQVLWDASNLRSDYVEELRRAVAENNFRRAKSLIEKWEIDVNNVRVNLNKLEKNDHILLNFVYFTTEKELEAVTDFIKFILKRGYQNLNHLNYKAKRSDISCKFLGFLLENGMDPTLARGRSLKETLCTTFILGEGKFFVEKCKELGFSLQLDKMNKEDILSVLAAAMNGYYYDDIRYLIKQDFIRTSEGNEILERKKFNLPENFYREISELITQKGHSK